MPPPDQIDHVRDVAFGGPDTFNNLWPLDGFLNEAAEREQNLNQFVLWAGKNGNAKSPTRIRDVPVGTVFVIYEMKLPDKT